MTDETGRIRAVAVVDRAVIEEGVSQVLGSNDALYLHWVGGACDRLVLVTYGHTLDGTGFTISTEGEFGGCLMIGILRRPELRQVGGEDDCRHD